MVHCEWQEVAVCPAGSECTGSAVILCLKPTEIVKKWYTQTMWGSTLVGPLCHYRHYRQYVYIIRICHLHLVAVFHFKHWEMLHIFFSCLSLVFESVSWGLSCGLCPLLFVTWPPFSSSPGLGLPFFFPSPPRLVPVINLIYCLWAD